jgi:hypothetical protein
MTSFIDFLEEREWRGDPDEILYQYLNEVEDLSRAEAVQLHTKIMDELIAVLRSYEAPPVVFQDILMSLTAQSIVHDEVIDLDQLKTHAIMFGRTLAILAVQMFQQREEQQS